MCHLDDAKEGIQGAITGTIMEQGSLEPSRATTPTNGSGVGGGADPRGVLVSREVRPLLKRRASMIMPRGSAMTALGLRTSLRNGGAYHAGRNAGLAAGMF